MPGDLLITNIKTIWGTYEKSPAGGVRGQSLAHLPHITDGWILIKDGTIQDVGKTSNLPEQAGNLKHLDAAGGDVLPCWADSHTHLVHAASRHQEFEMRILGRTYEEIAAAGGGILNSADKLRQMSESELFDRSYKLFQDAQRSGTGSVEIKSGYGLDFDSEMKMLSVARRLKETDEIPVKASFLGAHAIPREFKQNRDGYIELLIDKMIPYVADHGLADYIDAFCDVGFFTPSETGRILEAGIRHGLKPKIHANELGVSGGVQTGIAHGALSVDHLECMDDESINSLAASETFGTMLPGCAFFLGLTYPRARDMINANAKLAIASDFNPGTAPSYNMNLIVSLACIKLKMLPTEAVNAATINGAAAMELDHLTGSITIGKLANLIITKPLEDLAQYPYSFGNHPIEKVLIKGRVI